MDSDAFSDYHDDNANEVAALVEIGAIDPVTAQRIINVLRQHFTEFQHMSVTDRVDLARDLAGRI
jgi:hypothetical protein